MLVFHFPLIIAFSNHSSDYSFYYFCWALNRYRENRWIQIMFHYLLNVPVPKLKVFSPLFWTTFIRGVNGLDDISCIFKTILSDIILLIAIRITLRSLFITAYPNCYYVCWYYYYLIFIIYDFLYHHCILFIMYVSLNILGHCTAWRVS